MRAGIYIVALVFILLPLVSAENVSLTYGWNQFGIIGERSDLVEGTSERNVTILRGYNLIGYSSYNQTDYNNINITLANGTRMTIANAVSNNLINKQLSHWTNNSVNKYYELVPYDQQYLIRNNAYWVYWNDTTSANITFQGIGGALINNTIDYRNISFSNGTITGNITVAFNNGWIGTPANSVGEETILLFDPEGGGFTFALGDTFYLPTWKGYTIWANVPVTMIVPQTPTPSTPYNYPNSTLNLTITGSNGGRFGRFVSVTNNRSSSKLDVRDSVSQGTPSNGTTFFSSITGSNLALDSWNNTETPRTINLTFNSNPAMGVGSILNLTWNWNQVDWNITLVDYGIDSTRTNNVSSWINLKDYTSYYVTINSSRLNHYFKLIFTGT